MGFNERWVGQPSFIQVVGDTSQVVQSVEQALKHNLRITVRSGGHCYEDFVSGNVGGVIIDLSQMSDVTQTPDGTYWLEAGCTNWDVYNNLYRRYGVTLPGGSCYSVGLGGHIVGGGYGLLSRLYGLTVDYLSAVEVVVVNADHTVSVVTAAKGDPLTGDLFWAHTGGGGGNFGIVTRYGFKELPVPPESVWLSSVGWSWTAMNRTRFHRLLENYGHFLAANSGADSPYARLFSLLHLTQRAAGQVLLTTQVAGDGRDLLASFLAALSRGVGHPEAMSGSAGHHGAAPPGSRFLPWLQATQTLDGSGPNQRGKYKSAYMVKSWPSDQIDAVYNSLTDPHYSNPQALLQVDSYGCRINTVDPAATAVAQRSSIMKLQYQTYWVDPAEDQFHLAWIRKFYRDVYRSTGGVPASNDVTDGCYVNYPDVDLKQWEQLYYKENYPRLQQVKARWDPNNVFNHAQSIRAASVT